MKHVLGEPTTRILNNLYTTQSERVVIVNGEHGVLSVGGGGFGNVAIRATFGDVTIIARERESEDYSVDQDGDAALELYLWEREDEDGYYYTLADALSRRDVQQLGL